MEQNVGTKIREIRLSQGMTQKELGEKAGIAEPTIRRYELGKLNPKLETVKKIACALNVSWEDLYPSEQRGVAVAEDIFRFIRQQGADSSPKIEKVEEEKTNSVRAAAERLTEGLDDESLKKLLEYAEFLKSRQEKK